MTQRILVVDDDRAMVRTLCDIFRMRGWESRGAYSGEEAIALQRENGYAIILMDITMPGMGGVAAAESIRREDGGVRMILMTAHTSSDVITEAQQEPAWQVMPKPIDIAALLTLLR